MRALSAPRGASACMSCRPPPATTCKPRSSYSWDGLKRGYKPFTVIQHTISGAGWLRFERERLRVLPGQTMILTFPHDHRYWLEDNGRWEFFWISMNGQEALRVHRNVMAAGGPLQVLPASAVEHLAACALRMVEATPGDARRRLRARL